MSRIVYLETLKKNRPKPRPSSTLGHDHQKPAQTVEQSVKYPAHNLAIRKALGSLLSVLCFEQVFRTGEGLNVVPASSMWVFDGLDFWHEHEETVQILHLMRTGGAVER